MIRYALVNGTSTEPSKGLKGYCPGCGSVVIAKCGIINAHHWAHKNSLDCDPWWEPMTQWHINWQNSFPTEWREIIVRDEESKIYHRADVQTSNGLTIEFQNSYLSIEDLIKRNTFYKKIVWVVNASSFKERFVFTKQIPNPNLPPLSNYDFIVDKSGFSDFKRYYIREQLIAWGPIKRLELDDATLCNIMKQVNADKDDFWLFKWAHKRSTWLKSSAPVFLDFGNEFLYWIKIRKQVDSHLFYLKRLTKTQFLKKYNPQLDIVDE